MLKKKQKKTYGAERRITNPGFYTGGTYSIFDIIRTLESG